MCEVKGMQTRLNDADGEKNILHHGCSLGTSFVHPNFNQVLNSQSIPFIVLTISFRWLTTNLLEAPVKISHDVNVEFRKIRSGKRYDWKPIYEPFYVGRKAMPEFDERFVGFGVTRRSQVSTSLKPS